MQGGTLREYAMGVESLANGTSDSYALRASERTTPWCIENFESRFSSKTSSPMSKTTRDHANSVCSRFVPIVIQAASSAVGRPTSGNEYARPIGRRRDRSSSPPDSPTHERRVALPPFE